MKSHTVITQKDAKRITGGRTPNVPVEYEAALKSLQACIDLDEAKYWSDKADALAAWAKIYRSDEAELKARRLKLHAYRRMGQLAGELRPQRLYNLKGGKTKGSSPGPISLLLEHEIPIQTARISRKLSRIAPDKFSALVNAARPPPLSVIMNPRQSGSDAWRIFNANKGPSPSAFRAWSKSWPAAEMARGLTLDEARLAATICTELLEWLDAFDQALPKAAKA